MSAQFDSASPRHSGWTLGTAFQLGRVSNLPTVWTNTLAGMLLVGALIDLTHTAILLVAMSLAYTGGMYLNDAFDRDTDAKNRPERPIPSGVVSARDVFIAGFAMLAAAVVLVTWAGSGQSHGIESLLASLALISSIVVYNLWHKGNPLSPMLMGLCRMLVYLSCALTLSSTLPGLLILGALATFGYLIGLTYTAKQEQFGKLTTLWPLGFLTAPVVFGVAQSQGDTLTWACIAAVSAWTLYCLRLIIRRAPGDIPRAVTGLIAGIALIDALYIALAATAYEYGSIMTLFWVVACWTAFGFTLLLQRYVAGT